LGRTSAGTGVVGIDSAGQLVYSANKLDQANPAVAAPCRYIQRGEVNKSSFMFEIAESVWNDSAKYGSFGKRTITKIGKVYECGPVTLPAYNETDSYAREKDSVMESRSKWIEANKTPTDHLADEDEAFLDAEFRYLYSLILK
jgi:phage head maturation protease